MLPPFPLDSDGAFLAYAELLERNTDNHVAVDRIRWWATVCESLTRDLGPVQDRDWARDILPLRDSMPVWAALLGGHEHCRKFFDQFPFRPGEMIGLPAGWGLDRQIQAYNDSRIAWLLHSLGVSPEPPPYFWVKIDVGSRDRFFEWYPRWNSWLFDIMSRLLQEYRKSEFFEEPEPEPEQEGVNH